MDSPGLHSNLLQQYPESALDSKFKIAPVYHALLFLASEAYSNTCRLLPHISRLMPTPIFCFYLGLSGVIADLRLESHRWFAAHLPARAAHLPARAVHLPARADRLPARADRLPARADRLPARADRLPARADRLPARADRLPARADCLPARADRLPATADHLPATADHLPARADGRH